MEPNQIEADLTFINDAVQLHISDTGLKQEVSGKIDALRKHCANPPCKAVSKKKSGAKKSAVKTKGSSKK